MTTMIYSHTFVAATWADFLGRQLAVDDAVLESRTALVRRCSG